MKLGPKLNRKMLWVYVLAILFAGSPKQRTSTATRREHSSFPRKTAAHHPAIHAMTAPPRRQCSIASNRAHRAVRHHRT